jgi:hypothetical protein
MTKKVAVALAVASIAASATAAFAGPHAGTGINGSAHDLNVSAYTQDTFLRTCAFCHTPHNALNAANTTALTPLWNHADVGQGVTTPISFSPYQWVAPANQGKNFSTISDALAGPSRLCMSCHDGVTAADAHGAAGTSNVNGVAVGQAITAHYTDALGHQANRYIQDLQTTHPIGFNYDQAAEKRTTAEIVPSDHGFIVGALPVGDAAKTWDTTYLKRSIPETTKKIKDTLYNGLMTCATCHDVHNTLNVDDGTSHSYNYFLYAQEAGSAICLSCHIK